MSVNQGPQRTDMPFNEVVYDLVVEDQLASSFTAGSIVRDSSGRIISYIENGALVTVVRDSAGRVASFTMLGSTKTVTRDLSGRVTGVA